MASVYYRPLPSKKQRQLENGWIAHLHDMYPRNHKVYGGDFNLHHPMWGYHNKSSGVEDLIEKMTTYQLHLANPKGAKTRIGTTGQKDTTPDLTWVDNPYPQHQKWKCLEDSWGSDHLPIVFEFSVKRKPEEQKKKRQTRTIHWDKYREKLEESDLEDAPFEARLRKAIEAATICSNVDKDAPTPDLHLLKLLAIRLQAVQKYRKGTRTPENRRNITRATVEAKVYAEKLGMWRWLDHCTSLSEKTSIERLWATSRAMLGKKKTTRVTQSLALKMDKPEKDLAEMAGELFFPQPPPDATDSLNHT
ncbi:uncharacterized protein LOC120851083 [Ixodes scapularis]|uniref:uncharacterized protein LOC120851083 n=1 Tax=Ixodes scapularis TaxID=6945 RepID=UPI001A9D2C15|nr:uncharacterized protein LOC120851083 [Ixodes scapularis]